MPIRQGCKLASRASTWPRDHFCRNTMLPRRSWPTRWNEFLPISIPITAISLSSFWDMACSFVLGVPASLLSWQGWSTDPGPTRRNDFLPRSIRITAISLLSFGDMLCSFVFGAPAQLASLAGLEHGRTIPLADHRRLERRHRGGGCRKPRDLRARHRYRRLGTLSFVARRAGRLGGNAGARQPRWHRPVVVLARPRRPDVPHRRGYRGRARSPHRRRSP